MKINKKALKVLKITGQALLSIVLVFVILVTALMLFTRDKYQVPNVFGYSFINIISDSMSGDNPDSFNKGDLIIINRNADKKNLQVGQIITFETVIQGELVLNTHRIVKAYHSETGESAYETKGDANLANDEYLVSESNIIGVYTSKISGAGNFVSFLQSTTGFFVLIVLPALLFLGYELIQFIRSLLDYKLEKQKEQTALTEEELKEKIRAELLKEMQEKEQGKEEVKVGSKD